MKASMPKVSPLCKVLMIASIILFSQISNAQKRIKDEFYLTPQFSYFSLSANSFYGGLTFLQLFLKGSEENPDATFILSLDLGAGQVRNVFNNKTFSNHLGFNFYLVPNDNATGIKQFIHPCVSLQSVMVYDDKKSIALLPEIGISFWAVVDLKYGYELLSQPYFKTGSPHNLNFTLRPLLIIQYLNRRMD